jgi:hypothetical protein
LSARLNDTSLDLIGKLKNTNGTLTCLSPFLPPPYEEVESPISPVGLACPPTDDSIFYKLNYSGISRGRPLG